MIDKVIIVRFGHACYVYHEEKLILFHNCLTTLIRCFEQLHIKIEKEFRVDTKKMLSIYASQPNMDSNQRFENFKDIPLKD